MGREQANAVLAGLAAVISATFTDNATMAWAFGGFAVMSVALALVFRRGA